MECEGRMEYQGKMEYQEWYHLYVTEQHKVTYLEPKLKDTHLMPM